MQRNLSRIIEEKEFERAGDTRLDIRSNAAGRGNLEKMARDKMASERNSPHSEKVSILIHFKVTA